MGWAKFGAICKRWSESNWKKYLGIVVGASCLVISIAFPPAAGAVAIVAFTWGALNAIADVSAKIYDKDSSGWKAITFAVAKSTLFLVASLVAPVGDATNVAEEIAKILADSSVGIMDFLCDTFVEVTAEDDKMDDKIDADMTDAEQKDTKAVAAKKLMTFHKDFNLKTFCKNNKVPDKACTDKHSNGNPMTAGPVGKYLICIASR